MMQSEHRFVTAADVGQARDYTALVVLHSYRLGMPPDVDVVGPRGKDAPDRERRHDVVHIERFRDMSYPDQVRRIAALHREVEARAANLDAESVELVVDATGVGKPILDALKEARLRPRGVIITGGETSSRADDIYRVPKRELVTGVQVALQAGRLRIAEALPLADVLLQEFRGFRVNISLSGHAKFGNDVGSWREADHDDLVLATALGVWKLENHRATSKHVLRAIAARMWG